MASLKSVALALAIALFGASVSPATAHAEPAANQAAKAKKKTANRNAHLIKVMKSHGFSTSKARSVIAALTRYEKDFRRVHKDIAQARAAQRDESTANDKAAQARIDADKKQLERLKQRYKGQISRTLTAAEQRKLAQILAPPKAKGKVHKKRKPKQHKEKRS